MKNLKPINSKDDLTRAYPDRFEGIGKFPSTYHTYLKEDAIPVCAHTPQMPNSHKTPGRQEAGQTLGARSYCPSDITNGLGIIIRLLMESRW